MNEFDINNSQEKKDSAVEQGDQPAEKAEPAAYHHTHAQKPFLQRNKYRIRQVCGVLILAGVVVTTTVLLSKCGSDIDDAQSTAISVSDSSSEESTCETTPTTSDTTTSRTTTSSTTTTTKETAPMTTEEPTTTTPPNTTTPKKTTHNPKPTTTTAKPAPVPTDPPKIEVKNGITYVNGILIANKTYSLPADYNPGLDPNAQAAFYKMQQAAALEGINLYICSGFRSYSYQQQLYNSYVARDGVAAADRYSARPGYSEHQTGLAMDINYAGSWFDTTPEARWLAAHCSDYGFIIRYKPGKESSTGYVAESWHIRYLGDVSLCKSIEASGLSLEEYLGITSKYSD